MSKYGNGVSMRSAILQETKDVREILERNGMPEEDKKAVLDALKEMAYQWCTSNASACAMEAAIREMYPEMNEAVLFRKIIQKGVREEKMRETYPFA